jgi:hypothetical protein
MSDYLSRLVKKSHNSADVIKPRLASIFEPPVQYGLSFRGEYESDHLNVDPISDETEYNDLRPTRPSSDLASKNGELKELHKENHKPLVRSGAFQQTEQPEPQHLPDTPRLDRIHSILKHDIGRFPDQLTSQPSKQDHTAQLSSDNKPYKTHDIPHRTDDMKRQPNAHNPAIRPKEARQSAPVLSQSGQQPFEQVQAISSIYNKNHDMPHRTDGMKSQPYAHDPAIRSNEIRPSASVLSQSGQQPFEQVQALSSINYKNHDMAPRTDTKRNRSSAQDKEILPIVIKPAVLQKKMQITKPLELIEPPVIKVNIGRIEVRAATPPAPIPQQQVKQPSPVLSLDEYLRLRDGGGL